MSSTRIQPQRVSTVRRSQRVMVSVPVVVSGETEDGQRFAQETRTAVVNAHGALVLLASKVAIGQPLMLRNAKTEEDQECRVVHIAAAEAGQTEVGVEFLHPSPRFWRIAFPPLDWTPRSEEAKHSPPRST
jgi:PilZ domain